jgi:hypothetical protein
MPSFDDAFYEAVFYDCIISLQKVIWGTNYELMITDKYF